MSRVKWAVMSAPGSVVAAAYMTAVPSMSPVSAAVTGMATAMTPAVATVTPTMTTATVTSTRISDDS